MALTKEEYEALEDVVGPEYITQEPAILETYNQVWGNKLVFGEKWSKRPAAVLLPGSAEEVQAIVRVCNRYRIPFKPFSAGFEIVAIALESERGIMLDLKRMDRILEIDAKNMYAVVEPYVNAHRLQLELAKYGLTIGCLGAGPTGGVIAGSCCHFGSGTTQNSTGGLGRSVLGVEWVLPTGDMLRMGTAETGAGWFSAEGPGLSLRGVLRGHSGANGGHGVITKASVKLYPWFGPPEWERVGKPTSAKRLEKLFDGYKVFIIKFPTKDNMWEALPEIGKAEIATVAMMALPVVYGEGNDEVWAEIQKQKISTEALGEFDSLGVILGANSGREMEYREKCLMEVIKKWGGSVVPVPTDMKTMFFNLGVWGIGLVTRAFRSTTDFFISPCADATADALRKVREAAEEIVKPYMEKGVIEQMGTPDCFCLMTENYSTGGHLENVYFYDPFDTESVEATRELISQTEDPEGKLGRLGVPHLGGGLQIESVSHVHQRWGPKYDNYDVWLRKIKAALDPNNVGDWSAYIPPVFP